jgi:hypothetical protein
MLKKTIHLVVFVLVCVSAADEASALVLDGFQEWTQRTQLADLGGLEITSTGHARFTARVDQDATDVIIHPGGVLETLDTYKLPDSHPEPELTNVYVYGTWNAHDIQSFGVDRAAYIYMGPQGVINLERGYDDSSASYNVLAWLDEGQLGGQSLLLAPELDPEVWSIQIEDLGGGACRITAYGPPPAAADDPHPANQVADVPRDVILSWTPGSFAVAHDVYLGTSFEDVNSASTADAIYMGRQTQTSYDPEELTFGQVYYWRIDEVNGAPDNTIFKGPVWTFTIEPFAYPIETISATASSATAGAGPENTVNRSGLDENDLHSTGNTTMWLSDPAGAQPTWIQFEFDRVYKLHEMWVWNYNVTFEPILGFGLRDVTVEYSEDGIDWLTVGDVEFAQGSAQEGYAYNTTVDLGGVAARQIRLTVNSGYGALPQYGLSEVRFMYIPVTAREPQPADGAVNVSVEMDLAWRAGREAASHEVYLGTDANALALARSVDDASYNPGSLDLDTTYYWQVNEVNDTEAVGLWEGAVWSLTTQEFLVVDDFEAYNDEDNLIYEAWIDGWVNETGSTVGHLEAPFAETTIVNSGRQAMPLFYDNRGTSISEAQLALAQDWTVNGVQSLSLYFQGAANNGGELYVKINGIKIVYDGAAADIAKSTWQPWNIDLSTVGGNVGSVTSLAIGIEGAGTSGVVYIDDVRLYPKTPEYIVPVEPDRAALLAHYEFEGNANDSSGNGLNGAITDGQVVSPGKLDEGMGLQLYGDGYVDLGNPPSLDFDTSGWTVTAWFKTDMFGTGDPFKGTIFAKGGDTGGGHRYALIMSETNEGAVSLICDDDVTKEEAHSTTRTNDNQWHFVAGQRDGTAIRIFIDGLLEATTEVEADYNLSGTSQHSAYIGAITHHGDSNLYKLFRGLIDDVRVYGGALSEAEILWLSGRTALKHKPL